MHYIQWYFIGKHAVQIKINHEYTSKNWEKCKLSRFFLCTLVLHYTTNSNNLHNDRMILKYKLWFKPPKCVTMDLTVNFIHILIEITKLSTNTLPDNPRPRPKRKWRRDHLLSQLKIINARAECYHMGDFPVHINHRSYCIRRLSYLQLIV